MRIFLFPEHMYQLDFMPPFHYLICMSGASHVYFSSSPNILFSRPQHLKNFTKDKAKVWSGCDLFKIEQLVSTFIKIEFQFEWLQSPYVFYHTWFHIHFNPKFQFLGKFWDSPWGSNVNSTSSFPWRFVLFQNLWQLLNSKRHDRRRKNPLH